MVVALESIYAYLQTQNRNAMKTLLCLCLFLFLSTTMRAEDWPQFRGPTGQGPSTEAGLPLTWSETKNVKWKIAIPGKGWSSTVIQGDRIWLAQLNFQHGLNHLAAKYRARLALEGRLDNSYARNRSGKAVFRAPLNFDYGAI